MRNILKTGLFNVGEAVIARLPKISSLERKSRRQSWLSAYCILTRLFGALLFLMDFQGFVIHDTGP